MSGEQLSAFLAKLKDDAELQEKLKAASDAEDVVAIAKAADFVISAEAVNALNQEKDLSDEELENLAGGNGQSTWDILGWMNNYSLTGNCRANG